MIRLWKLALCMALTSKVLVAGQPAHCVTDSQCATDLYCDTDTLVCRQCIICDEYKRHPPTAAISCVKTVAHCGSCVKNLVEKYQGDSLSPCVPPVVQEQKSPSELPSYVWVIVAVVLVVFLVAGSIMYNTNILKTLTFSARTSMQSPMTSGGGMSPSGADPPPPYVAVPLQPMCQAVAATAPDDGTQGHTDEEALQPFIKHIPAGAPHMRRASDDCQAARPYNYPAYIRSSHPLPTIGELESDQNAARDGSEAVITPPSHYSRNINLSAKERKDENATAAGSSGSPKRAQSHSSSHGQKQDENGNTEHTAGESSGAEAGPRRAAPEQCGPSFVINLVKNVNTVYQHNDVTL